MQKVTDALFSLKEATASLCRASLVSHVLVSVQKRWRSYIEEFRGSEAVKGFYCKFIYGDYRV